MKLPVQFPNEADEIANAAEACRKLSIADRVRAISQLTRACQSLSSLSPNRDAAKRLREENDEQLRRRLQELAARHGT